MVNSHTSASLAAMWGAALNQDVVEVPDVPPVKLPPVGPVACPRCWRLVAFARPGSVKLSRHGGGRTPCAGSGKTLKEATDGVVDMLKAPPGDAYADSVSGAHGTAYDFEARAKLGLDDWRQDWMRHDRPDYQIGADVT